MGTHRIRINSRPGASAVYADMRSEDFAWVMAQIDRVMIEVAERSISDAEKDRNLQAVWSAPDRDLGRSTRHNHTNTMASVLGGIMKNIRLGRTRDLTDRLCDKLEIIFDVLVSGQERDLLPDLGISRVEFEEIGTAQPRTQFDQLFETAE